MSHGDDFGELRRRRGLRVARNGSERTATQSNSNFLVFRNRASLGFLWKRDRLLASTLHSALSRLSAPAPSSAIGSQQTYPFAPFPTLNPAAYLSNLRYPTPKRLNSVASRPLRSPSPHPPLPNPPTSQLPTPIPSLSLQTQVRERKRRHSLSIPPTPQSFLLFLSTPPFLTRSLFIGKSLDSSVGFWFSAYQWVGKGCAGAALVEMGMRVS